MRLGKHRTIVNNPALIAKTTFPVPMEAMRLCRNSKNDSKTLRGGRASGSRGFGRPWDMSGMGWAASMSEELGVGE